MPEDSVSARRPSVQFWLLAGLLLASLVGGAWFIRTDRTPPTFDDAWYLENSCRFYHALRDGGPWAFAKAYASSFRFKAPLISVLPLPFYFLAGPSLGAALCVHLFSLGVLGLYLYAFGARFFSRTAGLLAAAIALTCPVIFGLSRLFFVEIPFLACVTAAAYHLAASNGLRRPGSDRELGVLLGLGLLLKSVFPFYLFAPAAEFLWRRYRESGRAALGDLERPVKTILAIGGAIALTWYAWNLLYTLGYVYRAGFGDIAAHYHSSRVWDPHLLLDYWNRFAADGPSYYYVVAAACLGACLAARGLLSKRKLLGLWESNAGFRAAVLWVAFPFAVASFAVAKDIRFLTPCLPAFALLLAAALDHQTAGLRARPLLLALFFVIPVDQYTLQTLGHSVLSPIRLGPLALTQERTAYTAPPSTRGDWGQDRLVRELARDIGGGRRTVALGLEHPYLNANLLSYLSAREGLPLDFVNYGHMEDRVENVVSRLSEKDADYLLIIDGALLREVPASARVVDPQLRALLARRLLPFRPLREYALTSDVRVTLLERTGPIRMFGAPPS